MARRQDIDDILKQWPYDPNGLNVRLVENGERKVIQMRVDMGLLQLEVDGRPDGSQPQGHPTYLSFLEKRSQSDHDFQLNEEQCMEVDREFVQFYHRRICWLQLKEFAQAVSDADHTLALMDFCRQHSPSEQWTLSHEQYRPFVLYHRTQAMSLDLLEKDEGAELAIEEVNRGLTQLRTIFAQYNVEEQFDDDELVQRLVEFRENLRSRYEVGRTLKEQLADAIAAEQYELAAKLRDKLDNRETM